MRNTHKEDTLLYAGVTTDRTMNLMVRKSSLRIEGDFNYRVKWVHDIFCHSMWKYILKGVGLEELHKKAGLIPAKDLEEILDRLDELRVALPRISFTDKDFRNITGLKHLSGEEIRELVQGYIDLRIYGELELYFNPGTKNFKSILLDGYPLSLVVIKKSGNYSQRNKKPEHEYFFDLTLYGLMLFHNLMSGQFTKLPPQIFYKLKPGSQEIYRKIAQHSGSTFNILTIAEYIGYSESTISNIPKIIRLVEKCLNELKKKKLILGWKSEGTGRDTKYLIQRVNILPF